MRAPGPPAWFLISAVALASGCRSPAPRSAAGDDPASRIEGTWVLVSEDPGDGGPPEPERITFGATGYVVTDGQDAFTGTYQITVRQIILTFVDDGTSITLRWGYYLDHTGLHVKNKQGGISHYRRVPP